MKHFFSLLAAFLCAAAMQAQLSLAVNGCAITGDTTITVTDVELDAFTQEPVMLWSGTMFYKGQLTVIVERTAGVVDELCAGTCMSGSTEACDTMNFDLKFYNPPIQVYAHYFPAHVGQETIKYHFIGGGDDFVLTVNYVYSPTALEDVKVVNKAKKVLRGGRVLLEADGQVFDVNGKKLH